MFVKKVQLISVLLYIINFLIIQPSLVLCENSDLKIFGIKVGVVKQDGDLTSGQKIGYTILNWVLSGLAAIAIILVLLFLCCTAVCLNKCCNKSERNEEARDLENALGVDEEDFGTEGIIGNDRNVKNEGNEEDDRNEGNEGNEKIVKSERDEENGGKVHAR